MTVHILTMTCRDQPGIVASIAQGLFDLGANILENAQFTDEPTRMFCMRSRFEASIDDPAEIRAALADRAQALEADVEVRREADHVRTLVLVSKYDHCLLDLIYRWRQGEMPIALDLVVSNHPDLGDMVRAEGIAFEHVQVTRDTKAQAEDRILALIEEHDIELVVLARYMQILSDDLCKRLEGRAINIHHSFLPGFKGARPYHQAWERGVKLIGATAHYVTAELDEGPIIEQDVARVSHHSTVRELSAVGRDIERVVLSKAVHAHAEKRVFLMGERTIVFP